MSDERVPWRRAAYAGCGCLVLVGVVVGSALAYNWRAVSAALKRSSATLIDLAGIQRMLLSRYGAADISVNWIGGTTYSAEDGTWTGPRLVVTLVDPPFLEDLDLAAAEPKAREIALLVRAGLRDPAAAPTIEVVLAKKVGIGADDATRRVFRFSPEDLGSDAAPAP